MARMPLLARMMSASSKIAKLQLDDRKHFDFIPFAGLRHLVESIGFSELEKHFNEWNAVRPVAVEPSNNTLELYLQCEDEDRISFDVFRAIILVLGETFVERLSPRAKSKLIRWRNAWQRDAEETSAQIRILEQQDQELRELFERLDRRDKEDDTTASSTALHPYSQVFEEIVGEEEVGDTTASSSAFQPDFHFFEETVGEEEVGDATASSTTFQPDFQLYEELGGVANERDVGASSTAFQPDSQLSESELTRVSSNQDPERL